MLALPFAGNGSSLRADEAAVAVGTSPASATISSAIPTRRTPNMPPLHAPSPELVARNRITFWVSTGALVLLVAGCLRHRSQTLARRRELSKPVAAARSRRAA
jgi:hypothetical protein